MVCEASGLFLPSTFVNSDCWKVYGVEKINIWQLNHEQKGTHKPAKVICNDLLKIKALVFNMSYPLNCSNEVPYHSEVPLVAIPFH